MGTHVPIIKGAIKMHGFALITEDGVLYLDEPYSCGRAIREKWFQPGNEIELVEVVSINPMKHEIEIRIKDVKVRCYKLPLTEAAPNEWMYRYFAKMTELKNKIDLNDQD